MIVASILRPKGEQKETFPYLNAFPRIGISKSLTSRKIRRNYDILGYDGQESLGSLYDNERQGHASSGHPPGQNSIEITAPRMHREVVQNTVNVGQLDQSFILSEPYPPHIYEKYASGFSVTKTMADSHPFHRKMEETGNLLGKGIDRALKKKVQFIFLIVRQGEKIVDVFHFPLP